MLLTLELCCGHWWLAVPFADQTLSECEFVYLENRCVFYQVSSYVSFSLHLEVDSQVAKVGLEHPSLLLTCPELGLQVHTFMSGFS